jgi:rare lipoprotein A
MKGIRIIGTIASLMCLTLCPTLVAAQESAPSTETGVAACYSHRLVGHRTSSGQKYNPNALTAAHATIPVGTHVKVTNVENGKSVVVVINDHLSAHAGGRIIMISLIMRAKNWSSGEEGRPRLNWKSRAEVRNTLSSMVRMTPE